MRWIPDQAGNDKINDERVMINEVDTFDSEKLWLRP
ncbi:MAG: hypothetical protein ACD_2C00152G0001 [uncultured bacterium (gcode 4)]|uniref:Uncharacterized protein n=1 Tax=uncultured bacterium (gcode 4) TaxID=1234023 RepID=K2G5I8_9BACT|nr:MAG: hypothetical protein ACD_2C00152G0001 [uncultured bacterium (gcode 4)]